MLGVFYLCADIFIMWNLFFHCPSFGHSARLCFIIVTFPEYHHLHVCICQALFSLKKKKRKMSAASVLALKVLTLKMSRKPAS